MLREWGRRTKSVLLSSAWDKENKGENLAFVPFEMEVFGGFGLGKSGVVYTVLLPACN